MTELPVLAPEDQRILGSLLEKQTTVPATYPLTANALRSACNQTSNRDPVVDLDQETIERTARALKERGLLRIVWSDTGRRVLKYHQILDEVLGPRRRRARAHHGAAASRGAGAGRAAHPHRAVARLREPGRRGGVPAPDGGAPAAAGPRAGTATGAAGPPLGPPPRTGPAAGGGRRHARPSTGSPCSPTARRRGTPGCGRRTTPWPLRTPTQLVEELRVLPFETWLLDRVLAHADGRPVVEVGSGPGHVTAYLSDGGADATGIDLSPAMVDEARRRFPGPSVRGR